MAGPAPTAPYHPYRCFYRFRFILDYSGGQTTNFGCHSNGLVQWALGMDGSGPVEFEDQGSEWPAREPLHHADEGRLSARYASGVELLCRTTKRGFGVRFEGTEGWVDYSWQGLETSPASLKTSKLGPNEVHLPVAVPEDPQNKANQSRSYNHVRNFVQCVKAHRDPVEPVEAGHRTASLCHLGNIAMRLHRKIRWDPSKSKSSATMRPPSC